MLILAFDLNMLIMLLIFLLELLIIMANMRVLL